MQTNGKQRTDIVVSDDNNLAFSGTLGSTPMFIVDTPVGWSQGHRVTWSCSMQDDTQVGNVEFVCVSE